MSERNGVAIVNPRGGSRQAVLLAEELRQRLGREGVRLDVRLTEYAGHAERLAKEIPLDGADFLSVIGGDGTVHDVVGGLMQRSEPPSVPLALVAAGTGNTLHHEVGCSHFGASVEAILGGNTRWLDVVEVQSANAVAHCINIVGWGAAADINKKAEKLRVFGSQRYAMAALWQISWPRGRHAKLTLDDEVMEGELQFVIGCITRSTGTGMLIAPRAKLDDGKVDVVVLRGASRRQLLRLFQCVFDGSHLELPFVEYRQVESFSITHDESELNLDGEMKGTAPFLARVQPRILKVLHAPSSSVAAQ